MGKVKINLVTIPHEKQAYPTCGNWIFEDGGSIVIEVSETGNEDYAFLVGIHEMIESWLCRKRGITEESVTEFDIAYEAKRPEGDDSEPGDDPAAPYWKEHQFATQIERQVAEALGVDWSKYEETLYAL
jgi:hypothetical protein